MLCVMRAKRRGAQWHNTPLRQTKLSRVIKNANILADVPEACLISKKLINRRTGLTVTRPRENAKMKHV